jgi:hypothetical protein
VGPLRARRPFGARCAGGGGIRRLCGCHVVML